MNLRDEILKEHSRRQALKIAAWIDNSEEKFGMLLDLFLHDEYRVVQRSAWTISVIGEKYPSLIKKNIKKLVDRMGDKSAPVAVKRNVTRVLQFIDIPVKLQAKVMNICFEFLTDPKETIAVRVFSMTVLANLAKQYPDIKNEVEQTVNLQLKNPTPGLTVRARRVLKELSEL